MIEDTVTGGSAVQVILRLLGYCAKVKACRQELIKPELNSIGTLLRTLNLALASELGTLFAGGLAGPPPTLSRQVSLLPAAAVTVTAAAARAGQQQSKSATLTEQILELVSVIMSEATASLTPDKYRVCTVHITSQSHTTLKPLQRVSTSTNASFSRWL